MDVFSPPSSEYSGVFQNLAKDADKPASWAWEFPMDWDGEFRKKDDPKLGDGVHVDDVEKRIAEELSMDDGDDDDDDESDEEEWGGKRRSRRSAPSGPSQAAKDEAKDLAKEMKEVWGQVGLAKAQTAWLGKKLAVRAARDGLREEHGLENLRLDELGLDREIDLHLGLLRGWRGSDKIASFFKLKCVRAGEASERAGERAERAGGRA